MTKVGFFISMVLIHKKRNFSWEVLTVYGPAQHGLCQDFLRELHDKCHSVVLPLVLGVILI